MRAGMERGAQMDRCERQREQPGADLPPRDAGEPTATGKRDSLCMRAGPCIRPTFELSGGEAVRLNEGLGVTGGGQARYAVNATDPAAARYCAGKIASILTMRQRPLTDQHLLSAAPWRRR